MLASVPVPPAGAAAEGRRGAAGKADHDRRTARQPVRQQRASRARTRSDWRGGRAGSRDRAGRLARQRSCCRSRSRPQRSAPRPRRSKPHAKPHKRGAEGRRPADVPAPEPERPREAGRQERKPKKTAPQNAPAAGEMRTAYSAPRNRATAGCWRAPQPVVPAGTFASRWSAVPLTRRDVAPPGRRPRMDCFVYVLGSRGKNSPPDLCRLDQRRHAPSSSSTTPARAPARRADAPGCCCIRNGFPRAAQAMSREWHLKRDRAFRKKLALGLPR